MKQLIGKEDKLINIDQFIQEKLEEYKETYPALDLSMGSIEALLDMVENEEELDDSNPKEFSDILADLTAIYEATQERISKDVVKKELTEKELIQSTKGITYSKSWENFLSKFDLGENFNQLIPKSGVEVTEQDYVGALSLGIGLESAGQWVVADAALALIEKGFENVVVQLSSDLNRSYQTISGWVRTARTFPPNARDSSISFTVYREIGTAKLSDDSKEQAKLAQSMLKKAAQESWSSQEARSHVKALKGDTETKASPCYLVIDDQSGAMHLTDDPNLINNFHEDLTIVNIKTKKVLSFDKEKEQLNWVAIPIK